MINSRALPVFVSVMALMSANVAAAQQRGTAANNQRAEPESLLPAVAPTPATTPAPGASPAPAPVSTSQPIIQPLPGVDPLQPDKAPLQEWNIDDAAALLGFIRNIASEGLDPEEYHPEDLFDAIQTGENLNEVASRSFVWLVEDLRDGRTPMDARKQWFVVDPDPDLMPTGELMVEALDNHDVVVVLKGLNPIHPDYAALKKALADTPEAKEDRRKLIRANMDRWRWLPRDLGTQYLMTNVPEYQLRLTVNDNIIRSYKTIVGKPGRTATPQLMEQVRGVVFNPTWTVPQSIVKGEGLGERVLNNPSWAANKGYKATRGENGYISVVQQPGPTNSLGRMKLDMPNEHAIFLHDTPARNLFNNKDRALSHGCIRTERALELAITMAILGDGVDKDGAVEIANSGEYTKVALEKTMPVYITYFTMATDINGTMSTFSDIYDRDAPVLASLDKPRVRNRARVTDEEVVPIEAPGA
ncbi:L,D-transpeptidase family protein [Altericroceibacterium endophyticum]|uniref:L,D-transpeptidase family protein n=1 Tax=Altericroceibacterium endophyticum TaxID=1808508 RepID=A0A6I4T4K6_9SPHN|nr:L,D-transpeptidase family protein [Altericroceibacterium endophyticum]MXO65071.1 L,D-transpeptidase family protein [Altericroceibacterium endophyticum]